MTQHHWRQGLTRDALVAALVGELAVDFQAAMYPYLHPFVRFLRDGVDDGSLAPGDDLVAAADVVFNAVAWPYVHLRGRHGWPAARARTRVVGLVLNGIVTQRKEPA